MKKRILSGLMTLVMALSLLPTAAFAVEGRSIKDAPDVANTYVFMNGEETVDTQTLGDGENLLQPATPTNGTKHFTGWNTAQDGTGNAPTFGMVSVDDEDATYTYYAQWEEAYYVYFMAGADSNVVVYSEKVAKGGTVTNWPTYQPENGTVTGWKIKNGEDAVYTSTSKPTVSSDLYLVPVVETGFWVTFDAQGGTHVDSLYSPASVTLSNAVTTRAGYEFKGWSYTENGTVITDAAINPTTDTTLYAVWEAKKVNYLIVHWGENADDTNYSVLMSQVALGTAGETVDLNASNVELRDYNDSAHFTFKNADQNVVINGDGSTVVNVYWARKTYTLTFTDGTGSYEKKLACGKDAHTHTYTRSEWHGFLFIGYYEYFGGCFPADGGTEPTCGKTEHKHGDYCYEWVYNATPLTTITAKYDADISKYWEGEGKEGQIIKGYLDKNYVFKSSATGKNYSFLEKMPGQNLILTTNQYSGSTQYTWYYWLETKDGTEATAPAGKETKTDRNGTVYYKYHTSSVKANGLSLTYDEDYFPITGFKQRDENVPGFETKYEGQGRDWKTYYEANLYYNRAEYKLTYNNYGATDSASVKYESSLSDYNKTDVTRPTGVSATAEFKGWYTAPLGGGEKFDFTKETMPAHEVILYAYWEEQPVKLTVYDTKGGTHTKEYPLNTVIENTDKYAEAVKANGTDSVAYWVDADGKRILTSDVLSKDITIKPVVKTDVNAAYTVTYVKGDSSTNDTLTYLSGAVAEAKDFGGTAGLYWQDASGKTYYPGAEIGPITANVTLTLVTPGSATAETTTLTYHANFENANPADATVTVNVDEEYTVAGYGTIGSTTLPARSGYTFQGWATSSGTTTVAYTAGQKIYLDNVGSNDLYAVWQENAPTPTTYTLTYDANGGCFDNNTATTTKTENNLSAGSHNLQYSGDYVPTHEKSNNNDVIFLGWTTTDTEDKVYGLNDKAELAKISIVSSVTISDSDETVYAVWGEDVVGGIDGGEDSGNGTPDVYEAKITYKIENGTWTTTEGDNADIVAYVKLAEKAEGSNVWTSVSATLGDGYLAGGTEQKVPTGMQPATGYTAPGAWENATGTTVNIDDTTTVAGDATYTYSFTPAALLSITKKADKTSARIGDTITYTIEVKNTGAADFSESYAVEDLLPKTLTFVSASPAATSDTTNQDGTRKLTWTFTNGLAKDTTQTITVAATVNDTAEIGQKIENVATIQGKDDVPGGKSEVPVTDSNVTVEKKVNKTSVKVGEDVVYTIIVKNTGNEVVTGYDVTDVLPNGGCLKYKTGTATSGNGINFDEETLTWSGVEIPANGTVELKITMTAMNVTSTAVVNTVKVTKDKKPVAEGTAPGVKIEENGGDDGDDDKTTTYYTAIRKVDAQDRHALKGAKFYLYDKNGTKLGSSYGVSDKDGYAVITVSAESNPKNGTYYAMEETAPEGYVRSNDKYSVKFYDSKTEAMQHAEEVLNYRTSTPGMLNDTDHFAYVIGYRDGLVRPYGLITRAETTTIFFRLLKDNVRDNNLRYSNVYTDVPDTYWANIAISTMSDLGIVQGYSDGTFNPYAPITRAQFAAICARFDTDPSVQTGEQTFSDIDGHWAEGYIERAAQLGWIKGFEDGTFRPDTYITRAQAMTMINRVLNRIPEDEDDLLDDMNVWPDNTPDMWCYLAVQEATNSHDFKHKSGNYETWTDMNSDPDWTRYEN